MTQAVKNILVVRVHHNMAIAVSTQNIQITAFNFHHNPILLTPENIKSGLQELPREFHNRKIKDNLVDVKDLIKIIKTVNPEIVHINALQDLLPVYIAAKMNGANHRKPAIVAMSRNPLTWKSKKKAWVYSRIIKSFTDGFVALSSVHRDQLLKLGYPKPKLTFIPNPYDPTQLDFYNPIETEKQDQTINILYIANICERKAQDILIHAASRVIKTHPHVKFSLIGRVLIGEEAYAEKLHALVKSYGIEESINFMGGIPYVHAINALQSCDIIAFPTRSEMMPRALIEAMVFGKPVVASAVDGILDLVQNGKTGLLVPPENVDELVYAINNLIEHPDFAKTIGLAGRKYVLEFCSPEKVGKEFNDFYSHVLNQP